MPSAVARGLLLAVLLAGIGTAVVNRDALDVDAVARWTRELGALGPLLFVLAYALATVLFLPGSILTLAGGALFGPLWGTLYSLAGATLGASLAFVIARYLAGGWVERHSAGRLDRLRQGVAAEGWRFVAFVRLVPLFPFNLLNYVLGLTGIRLSAYILASFVFMAPGALAYTYLGYAGREALLGGQAMIQKVLLALALMAVVLFLPRLVGRLRQGPLLSVEDLRGRLAAEPPPLLLDVRTAQEFSGELGHIGGALNIPLDALPQSLDELSEHLERPIAIVCHTDRRSKRAARILAKRGYGEVQVVEGGMTAWTQRGYPVEEAGQ
jgi:uncharacterized membrane protein YdjX (TVP38/TMEM64 family)/rhodanese-related sulfurtransferase